MNFGILDPPPTSSTESTLTPIFYTSYLKLCSNLVICSKMSMAEFNKVYRVNVSEKSSSSNRLSTDISVSAIPDNIFLCFWIAYNSFRHALLLYLMFRLVFYSNFLDMYSNTFLSISRHPILRSAFSVITSILPSVNFIALAESFECPKSIKITFLPSPISDFLNPP